MRTWWGLAVATIGSAGCTQEHGAAPRPGCAERAPWLHEAEHSVEILDGLIEAGGDLGVALIELAALAVRAGTGVLTDDREILSAEFGAGLVVVADTSRLELGGVRVADGSVDRLLVELGEGQDDLAVALPDWTPQGLGLDHVQLDAPAPAQDALRAAVDASLALSDDQERLSRARAALAIRIGAEPRRCGSAEATAVSAPVVPAPSHPLEQSVSANLLDGRAAVSVVLEGIDAAEQLLEALRIQADPGTLPQEPGPEQIALERHADQALAQLDVLASRLSYAGLGLGDGSLEHMDVLWSDGAQHTTFSTTLPDLTSGGLGLQPDGLDLRTLDGAEDVVARIDAALAHLEEQQILLSGFDQVLAILQDMTQTKEE